MIKMFLGVFLLSLLHLNNLACSGNQSSAPSTQPAKPTPPTELKAEFSVVVESINKMPADEQRCQISGMGSKITLTCQGVELKLNAPDEFKAQLRAYLLDKRINWLPPATAPATVEPTGGELYLIEFINGADRYTLSSAILLEADRSVSLASQTNSVAVLIAWVLMRGGLIPEKAA